MPSYCAVCAFCRCSAEMPSPTLPRKTTASASDRSELADRRFHIGRSRRFSARSSDPYDAAGGKHASRQTRVKRRALRVPKPAQAVVDLLLHAFQRLLLLKHRLLLLLRAFLRCGRCPGSGRKSAISGSGISSARRYANRVQDLKLLRSVIAVAGSGEIYAGVSSPMVS